ncbi:MAG: D-alanyl-D-alanine carboxypeptidase/D-alanyl-D-alanine-endopeptidase [Bacteroidaceae bacterium]|nr:D-alanyl-D-alanine carboxypeptidase/D-alanyl-D-alanine-endopeptidase [Bacteroidaceae bacterium]
MQKRISYSFFPTLFVWALLFTSCGSRRALTDQYYQQLIQQQKSAEVVTTKPETTQPPVEQIQQPSDARQNVSLIARRDRGTWLGELQYALDSLCNIPLFETTQLGLYVYDLTDDIPLYALNSNQRMRPASCQKLVTSISALNFLGPDYRFSTEVFTTGNIVDGVLQGDLYVVGGMDPLLSMGDLRQLADSLRAMGLKNIRGRLYRDVSRKDDLELGMGWCWDDDYGPLTALSVDGKDQFSSVWPGLLRAAGIMCNGTCVDKQRPTSAVSLRAIQHSMDDVLIPMMKESDNIYAESMFYQLAFLSGQKGAGRKQAISYIEKLISSLGLNPEPYQIADGSGLSLYNYVSPLMLSTLLIYAYRTEAIRNHLYPSLPIAGVDGTLSKRMLDTPAFQRIHAKTGTVNGISSLCGYAEAGNGHLLVFSIINQGVVRSAQGKDFQDQVCILLCR